MLYFKYFELKIKSKYENPLKAKHDDGGKNELNFLRVFCQFKTELIFSSFVSCFINWLGTTCNVMVMSFDEYDIYIYMNK